MKLLGETGRPKVCASQASYLGTPLPLASAI